MTKEGKEDFKDSPKCWICDNDYVENYISKRSMSYHWKYRRAARRDCNINLKLNNKISVVFHNLKNYDSYLIMQELGKLNLKISNRLSFIDSFQFLNSSLDT